MGLLDRLKGTKDKGKHLEDWKVKAAEKEAFRTETKRRKEEAFNRRLANAQARGKARAVPISERISSAASGVGKFIQSEGFQNVARAGSGFAMGSAPPRRTRKTTTKRKATKKHTKKAGKRRSSGRRQPDFSSMLLGY